MNEFALDDGLVHLNHAGIAPWPRRTVQAITRFAEENMRRGSQRYMQWIDVETALRGQLRTLINAPSIDDIALLKSTSEALSVVAYGLPWKAGENVVYPAQEFPSNRVVWESLERRYGIEARPVDIARGTTPEEALMARVDQKTRLIATSSVQYASGLRMDLHRLGAFCREHDIFFCLDGIQSIGAFPLDVQAVHADFVAADGHKWMLGPEGVALFYCRGELRELLRLHQYGWHMVEDLYDFDSTQWTPAHGARRFEAGSANTLGIHGLHASLALILETGIESISDSISRNISYLIDKLTDLSSEIRSPLAPERRSGIVVFHHPAIDTQALYEHLQAHNVICALRGGGIRFSPHYYTSTAAMDRAIGLIEEKVKK